MDDLLRRVGDLVTSESDVALWRELLAYIKPIEQCDDWEAQLENETTAYGILVLLQAMGLIAEDNLKLLLVLSEKLNRENVVSLVQRFKDDKSCPDPLDHLFRRIAFVEKLGKRWRDLALFGLNLKAEDIDEIESDARRSGSSLPAVAYSALLTWRRCQGKMASAKTLEVALRNAGEKAIADTLFP